MAGTPSSPELGSRKRGSGLGSEDSGEAEPLQRGSSIKRMRGSGALGRGSCPEATDAVAGEWHQRRYQEKDPASADAIGNQDGVEASVARERLDHVQHPAKLQSLQNLIVSVEHARVDEATHGPSLQNHRRLRQHANDMAQQPTRHRVEITAAQKHGALPIRKNALQHAEQRVLGGAAGAHNAYDFARVRVRTDAAEEIARGRGPGSRLLRVLGDESLQAVDEAEAEGYGDAEVAYLYVSPIEVGTQRRDHREYGNHEGGAQPRYERDPVGVGHLEKFSAVVLVRPDADLLEPYALLVEAAADGGAGNGVVEDAVDVAVGFEHHALQNLRGAEEPAVGEEIEREGGRQGYRHRDGHHVAQGYELHQERREGERRLVDVQADHLVDDVDVAGDEGEQRTHAGPQLGRR
ncbi:NmrA family protein [Babesia caballi]|uniref:NmrA family protein n=1 Tax=Babesia caballi TaxID=5871 RepID=A0AAV4LN84_BABCB|nr:NmrA family protein [Babesia caballi]